MSPCAPACTRTHVLASEGMRDTSAMDQNRNQLRARQLHHNPVRRRSTRRCRYCHPGGQGHTQMRWRISLRRTRRQGHQYVRHRARGGKAHADREIVKVTRRPFLPTAPSGVATISCIIGANAIGLRRNVQLLQPHSRSWTPPSVNIRTRSSRPSAEKTRRKSAKRPRRIASRQPLQGSVIVLGEGEVLCYDMITGRSFRGDAETIRTSSQRYRRPSPRRRVRRPQRLLPVCGAGYSPGRGGPGMERRQPTKTQPRKSYLNECNQPCIAVAFQKMPIRDYEKF